jgi:hypothetical protein
VYLRCGCILYSYSPPSPVRTDISVHRRKHDNNDEILTPITNLQTLLPYSKSLQQDLDGWNAHYQNPPPHWVMNFIPRAYLKRGHKLAEEVYEYLQHHPDGCCYRVEYEPIGHRWCLIGTVIPQTIRRKSRRGGDMWWEGREKLVNFGMV